MRSSGVAHGGVFPAHVPLVLNFLGMFLLLLSCCIWLRVARVDPALPCSDSRVGSGHARWPYAVLLFSELGREFASRTETESFSAFVWT